MCEVYDFSWPVEYSEITGIIRMPWVRLPQSS